MITWFGLLFCALQALSIVMICADAGSWHGRSNGEKVFGIIASLCMVFFALTVGTVDHRY